jgi:hypothetical protein
MRNEWWTPGFTHSMLHCLYSVELKIGDNDRLNRHVPDIGRRYSFWALFQLQIVTVHWN